LVTKAIVAGKPVVEFSEGKVAREIGKLWEKMGEAKK
jgi:hypothetical protein